MRNPLLLCLGHQEPSTRSLPKDPPRNRPSNLPTSSPITPMPTQRMFKNKFLSRGATGWVFQIDDSITLKYARDGRSNIFQTEIIIYNMFNKHKPSPYSLQSILQHLNLNLLPFMCGGSLEVRIKANQRRNKSGALTIHQKEPLQIVLGLSNHHELQRTINQYIYHSHYLDRLDSSPAINKHLESEYPLLTTSCI